MSSPSPEPYLLRLGRRLTAGLAGMSDERRSAHAAFLLDRMNPDGGFRGRQVTDDPDDPASQTLAQDSDLYYTSFGLRALSLLERFPPELAEHVASFLRQPGKATASVVDVVNWLYCAVMVQLHGGPDLMAGAASNWPEQLARSLEQFRTEDGGYAKTTEGAAGSTYHTFLVVLCLELIQQPVHDSERIIRFLMERQRDDGGFVEITPMKRSGTNPTAAAVATLTILNGLTEETRQEVARFLTDVRSDDGGFQANDRIPFGDSLSTFTGYLTCLDLGLTDILTPRKIQKFLAQLELKHGGYRAAVWDNAADVEYTFYGLGLTALMNSQLNEQPNPETSN